MKRRWIVSPKFDSFFILLPHYIGIFLIIIFPSFFNKLNEHIPAGIWLFLIVFVDVAHVYSTLFRTYFDKSAWQHNSNTLILIPLICFIIGVIAYSIDPIWFWRLLAYIAVYHFIKQQYGFLKIYLNKFETPVWEKQLDILLIYSFTLLPILIWHFTGLKNFSWFVENDFLFIENQGFKKILTILNVIIILGFIFKECLLYFHTKTFHLPKSLFMLGTALSWFVGIVVFNGDLAFTFLNVVSHGIPYIALVWYFGQMNYKDKLQNPFLSRIFNLKSLWIFLGSILLFAYLEEGLWDGLVWNEHKQLFPWFQHFNSWDRENFLQVMIPLLTLPQFTHYILDGYIWKIKDENFVWKQ